MDNTSNRDPKYSGINTTQGGLLDVLLALKSNILKSTHVATFAKVQSIDTVNQTVTVKPFPLSKEESEKNIVCQCCMMPIITKNESINIEWVSIIETLALNDVVLVVFTDRNSLQNLTQSKTNQKLTALNTNVDLHSDKYGVIVGMYYKAS